MNNEIEQETEQKNASSPQAEMEAMLKEIEQEIGIEEMNRLLQDAMKRRAEENPNGIENKIMRIQKGNFEEMLMPEQYADFTSAGTIAELLHAYYENPGEETFATLMLEVSWCMMNEGAVLVPSIIRDGRLDMPLLNDEQDGDWIPLFTSIEASKVWPEEAEMRPIALEMAVLLATIRSGFKGIVLNPGTIENMPLDRVMLDHMERACNETRREEALKKQNSAQTLLN